MKISEMRESNEEELKQRLSGSRRELFDLRVARAAGKLEKPHQLRKARRQIARLETVRRQKELAAAEKKE